MNSRASRAQSTTSNQGCQANTSTSNSCDTRTQAFCVSDLGRAVCIGPCHPCNVSLISMIGVRHCRWEYCFMHVHSRICLLRPIYLQSVGEPDQDTRRGLMLTATGSQSLHGTCEPLQEAMLCPMIFLTANCSSPDELLWTWADADKIAQSLRLRSFSCQR